MPGRRASSLFCPLRGAPTIALIALCAFGADLPAAAPPAAGASGPFETRIEGHTGAAVVRDCGTPGVLCVGAGKQYATIQQAADKVRPGDTVQVFNGTYAGFRVTASGEPEAPITFIAAGDQVVIRTPGPISAWKDNIEVEDCGYVVVDGFTVQHAPRAGISVIEAHDVIVRNNVVGPSMKWGIFSGFSPNILVENNKTFGSAQQHGIYLSNSRVPHDNYVVRGNESYRNGMNGIQLNGDCKTTTERRASDGIIEDAVVEDNVVHDNDKKGLSIISAPGAVIRNNLIFNNGILGGAGGIHLTDELGCHLPSIDAVVVYNTIVEPKMAGIRISDEATGALIANNVLIGARPVVDETSRSNTFNAINVARDSAERVLANAASGNFHLLVSSPAVGAARAEYAGPSAPAYDIEGNERPSSGSNSAGAYEYTSLPPLDETPPTTPANFIAKAVSGTQVALSWSPSTDPYSMTNQASGVLGYYVFRSGRRVAFTKATTYTEDGLSPQTGYSYTVSACDAAMNVSPATAPAVVTTLAPSTARNRHQ
jgi:hypothetical protein